MIFLFQNYCTNCKQPKLPTNKKLHTLAVPKKLQFSFCSSHWCSGRDSNPHAFGHRILNPACLPIPPPELTSQQPHDALHTRILSSLLTFRNPPPHTPLKEHTTHEISLALAHNPYDLYNPLMVSVSQVIQHLLPLAMHITAFTEPF